MIDLNSEEVVSLTDAARLLPRRRAGKKPNVATVYRWASRGCRGMRLEVLRVGGTLCTSKQALQRFCEALTSGHAATLTTPSVMSRQRKQAVEQAERELAEAGIQ